jgi:hypothetical protein
MKINYNILMEEIIGKLTDKPKLLLHACCGICSSSVIERLNPYFDITILYYNPNIYPESEYIKRLNTQKELLEKAGYNINLINLGYLEEEFLVKGLEKEPEGGARCNKCFYIRLNKTAQYAKENNFDYFTTTLSVSPHKDSQMLNQIGKILEEKYNINYLYSDFKKKEGFKRSNELSRKYNLYRQEYCGCKYSLEETTIKQ